MSKTDGQRGKSKHAFFIKAVNDLAQAFEHRYWTMGDTSYKEQLCLTYIETNLISYEDAEKILYKCGITKRNNPIVYLRLNNHVEEVMGMHISKTDFGERKLNSLRLY